MPWARRFVAVPTQELRLDDPVTASQKADAHQIRNYMLRVPDVFARLRAGASDADFAALRRDTADSHNREIGEAYLHLFSPEGRSHRIEADYTEERGLVVQRGHHRVEAASGLGLGYLPVHVRAADQQTLDRLSQRYEERIAISDPNTVRAMGALDQAHRSERDNVARLSGPDLSRGRDPDRSR